MFISSASEARTIHRIILREELSLVMFRYKNVNGLLTNTMALL